MRKEKELVSLLRGLADLLVEESAANPTFAARVELLLSGLPEGKARSPERKLSLELAPLPDIYEEWTKRGETEFRLWLREQPMAVLRLIIRRQDLDPTRRTTKWKELEKLADFISDGMRSRLARGSAFMGRGSPS